MKLSSSSILSRIKNNIKNNIEYIIFFVLIIILVILITKRNLDTFLSVEHGLNRLDAIIYINPTSTPNNPRPIHNYNILNQLRLNSMLNSKIHEINPNNLIQNSTNNRNINMQPQSERLALLQAQLMALKMIRKNDWKKALILGGDSQLDGYGMDGSVEILNDVINKSLDTLESKNPNWNVIVLSQDIAAHAVKAKIVNDVEKQVIEDPSMGQSYEIYDAGGKIKPLRLEKITKANMDVDANPTGYASLSSAYIIQGSYVDKMMGLFDIDGNVGNIARDDWYRLSL
jgi:hypothetical protein